MMPTGFESVFPRKAGFPGPDLLAGSLQIKKGFAYFKLIPLIYCGDPNGTRTRVFGVRGRCPRPLDDGTRHGGLNTEWGMKSQILFGNDPQQLKSTLQQAAGNLPP